VSFSGDTSIRRTSRTAVVRRGRARTEPGI
jgi:hypothetical protein